MTGDSPDDLSTTHSSRLPNWSLISELFGCLADPTCQEGLSTADTEKIVAVDDTSSMSWHPCSNSVARSEIFILCYVID